MSSAAHCAEVLLNRIFPCKRRVSKLLLSSQQTANSKQQTNITDSQGPVLDDGLHGVQRFEAQHQLAVRIRDELVVEGLYLAALGVVVMLGDV